MRRRRRRYVVSILHTSSWVGGGWGVQEPKTKGKRQGYFLRSAQLQLPDLRQRENEDCEVGGDG